LPGVDLGDRIDLAGAEEDAVTANERRRIARESYLAFAAGDRGFFETHLGEDFEFSSPPDPRLDRDGWFERCWPAAGLGQTFEFHRLVDAGDEVIVTYELHRPDGTGGRNTEILTFDGENRIVRTEVYFGWNLS
jgi:ketosteroid isomerase-like protein